MTTLLLRLGGTSQTWAGYRLIANKNAVPTAPLPRKSGVAGLLGAATGRRELAALVREFDLHVRVDWTNPAVTDIQTLNPLPVGVRDHADRSNRMRTANMAAKIRHERRGEGNFPTVLMNRQFLPHSEFIVALTSTQAGDWMAALREPKFMTYLGRRADAPTFPFVLGVTDDEAVHALSHMPIAGQGRDTPVTARAYHVTGTYHVHEHAQTPLHASPPVATREDQLAWATQHLHR